MDSHAGTWPATWTWTSQYCLLSKKEWGGTVDLLPWGWDEDWTYVAVWAALHLHHPFWGRADKWSFSLLYNSHGDECGTYARRLPETSIWEFKYSGSNWEGQLIILRLWKRDSRDRTARCPWPSSEAGWFDLLGTVLSYLTLLSFCLLCF